MKRAWNIIFTGALITFAVCMLNAAPADSAVSSREKMKSSNLVREAIELYKAENYSKAIPIFEQALALNPEDKLAFRYLNMYNQLILEPYCKRASDLYFSGDYPGAVRQWEYILKRSPGDIRVQELVEEALSRLGEKNLELNYASVEKLIKQERFIEASKELEKIISEFPGEKRAKDMLAKLSSSLNTNTIRQHYNKAGQLMDGGEYDSAVRELEAVLAINPKQELASRLIVVARRKKLESLYTEADKSLKDGHYGAARSLYLSILQENPTDEETRTIATRLEEVIKFIPDITKDSPSEQAMKTSLFHYISNEGNPKAALLAAWYATQLDTKNALALAVRDLMEEKLSSTIPQLEPPGQEMNIVDQYMFAALNHIYEGRYDLAAEECSLVLELEPDNLLALKRLGSAYHLMGKKDKARKIWQRASKLAPNDEELKEFLEMLI